MSRHLALKARQPHRTIPVNVVALSPNRTVNVHRSLPPVDLPLVSRLSPPTSTRVVVAALQRATRRSQNKTIANPLLKLAGYQTDSQAASIACPLNFFAGYQADSQVASIACPLNRPYRPEGADVGLKISPAIEPTPRTA